MKKEIAEKKPSKAAQEKAAKAISASRRTQVARRDGLLAGCMDEMRLAQRALLNVVSRLEAVTADLTPDAAEWCEGLRKEWQGRWENIWLNEQKLIAIKESQPIL